MPQLAHAHIQSMLARVCFLWACAVCCIPPLHAASPSAGATLERDTALLQAVTNVASRLPVMDDHTTSLCAAIMGRLVGKACG